MVKWTEVPSAERYHLLVHSQATGHALNLTYTNFTAVVGNLQPSTNYDCYVYTVNQAGTGSRSKVRTITTCELSLSVHLEPKKTVGTVMLRDQLI